MASGQWKLLRLAEARLLESGWRRHLERIVDIRIGFILEGTAYWHINETEYEVGPGDVIVVLPGTYRAAYTSSKFSHASAWLRWTTSNQTANLDSHEDIPDWLLLPARIHVGLDQSNELFSLLRYANTETELQRPGSDEMADTFIRQFLIRLYRCTSGESVGDFRRLSFDESRSFNCPSVALNRALEFIHMHLDQPLYIAEIAEACGYSESHLRRLFREHIGKSPTEYITKSRIARAQRLLRTDQFSISEVSQEVGFADPFHFSRTFKSLVCVPPREFAKGGMPVTS